MKSLKWLGARILFPGTLAWNVLLGRILKIRNWWDFIDEHVIVGAFPFPFDVNNMATHGVRAVVNTCNEYGGPVSQYQKHSIEQLHILGHSWWVNSNRNRISFDIPISNSLKYDYDCRTTDDSAYLRPKKFLLKMPCLRNRSLVLADCEQLSATR